MRLLGCLLFSFLCCLQTQAQSKRASGFRGKVLNEDVQIYEQADFDSKVIATVEAGQVFDISKTVINQAFYKIRLRAGLLGFVSEDDIQPLFKAEKSGRALKSRERKRPTITKNKSFEQTRYVGASYGLIDYQEETMGGKPHENLGFLALKLSGSNVLIEGLPTDVNLMFHSGAPTYYEKATGRGASGFLFLGDILFQTYWPMGPNVLTYVGFGPLMKYAKFDVEVHDNTSGKDQPFALDEISVGAAFDAGLGFRMGSMALRVDYQYFWEKQMYGGFMGALQWAF